MERTIILIPARMASRRLPDKPLAEINGVPMILHVAKRAIQTKAPVWITSGDEVILETAQKAGFQAIWTDPDLPSGTDRCVAALTELEAADYDIVINLQGDMPNISSDAIRACWIALLEAGADCDCATLVHLCDEQQKENPDQVKAVLTGAEGDPNRRVLYFSRATIPTGEGDVWGHVGIYAWRRASLMRFAQIPPSALEKRERLEQLRALENNMVIVAAAIDVPPLSVDSPADLAEARKMMAS